MQMLKGIGLTDQQQAVLMFISTLFIALGTYAVPPNFPIWVSVLLYLLGALGFALKEALGVSSTPVPTPPSSTPPAPVPQFDVTAAKAAGFRVFVNSEYPGGYVLLLQGIYSDIFGKPLGSAIPAGTSDEV